MSINLSRAFRDLLAPENRRVTLVISVLLSVVIWLGKKSGVSALEGALGFGVSLLNVSYGLQAIRQFHSRGAQATLPGSAALFSGLPLALGFGLANLPHAALMILMAAAALVIGSKALMGLGLWLVLCYFLVWMTAYDALAINYTRFLNLSDALNLQKALGTINQARGPYLQAALLPFLYTFPIYVGSVMADRYLHSHGILVLPGMILSQLSILWNLMALKQWVALLQPTPPQTQEPGLNPS